MKRRLIIARGLINEPELVILDEPTTGLDPQARHVVWDRLYQLKREGVTLIITTHYMDEAEQLCDRLVVMDKGRIVAEGSPRELLERYSTRDVLEMRFDADQHLQAMPVIEEVAERTEHLPDRVMIYTHNADEVAAYLARRDIHPISTLIRRSTLEDVFLRLTGRQLIE